MPPFCFVRLLIISAKIGTETSKIGPESAKIGPETSKIGPESAKFGFDPDGHASGLFIRNED